jgi:dolichol-phosphate mannosyltransferase
LLLNKRTLSNAVVIIPTYKERENIHAIIDAVLALPKDFHILIVDDNSPDGTADVVKKFAVKWPNIDISQGEKNGLGAAYVRGMTHAIEKMGADIIFEMDADGQHNPKKIGEFLEKIDEGYDMVIGTRYSAGGGIPKNWGLKRKIYSIFANILIRSILMRFYIHDWTGGYRAIKKEVFLSVKSKIK